MHLSDGVLPAPTLFGGFAVAGVLTGVAVRRLRTEDLPRVAVMSSALFVASLVHVRLGAFSAHFLLNGLAGLVLGLEAFLAVAVGILLQQMLFYHGGLTTLGVNACLMGIPAVLSGWGYRWGRRRLAPRLHRWWAGGMVAGAVALSAVGGAGLLMTAGREFGGVAGLLLLTHLPILLIEGALGVAVVAFLEQVKPELLP